MALVVRHLIREFHDPLRGEDEMLQYLEAIDNATVKQLIGSPRDIALTPDGKLASNGFMLTPLAFKQLCRYTAKGLYGLVADVGAVITNVRSLDAYTSVPLAAEIINKVVTLRFNVPDGISSKALILNHESKTVDGIVGARYHYTPHYQLYDCVKQMTHGQGGSIFVRGIVCGRRLEFTLVRGNTNIHGGHIMAPALYFTNSEAGEAGIHACGAMTIGPASGETIHVLNTPKHVAHTAKDFDQRLGALYNHALEQSRGMHSMFPDYGRRLNEWLDVVHNGAITESRRRALTGRVRKYVGTNLAEEIIRKVLFQGADSKVIPAKVPIEDVAKRTYRDLVLTLCREGRGRYHTLRELLERAAFSFLT